jgi:hypothetical protein
VCERERERKRERERERERERQRERERERERERKREKLIREESGKDKERVSIRKNRVEGLIRGVI